MPGPYRARISGTGAAFSGGELWLGMMPRSRKGGDLRRDPRLGLHSATLDLELAEGDAKIDGRAVEVTDAATIARWRDEHSPPAGPFDLFRAEVDRIVLTRVAPSGDHLVIESWTPAGGLGRDRRA